ncbi:sugar ABC transporter substrate-binding protein [Microbacterium horticulturae]|uniref:Sugar ABC transporter substrate-binding protein n=1 Tax=Microbacterium horticulturae TaxID=3028316 RepID=A0ABY8BZ63_9MICO|nr:sugar ABC transporter substrate-binding protein [Microbacterium sp. KACC 23027]WEG08131.1 sugar ABC transporter substrate-binding protein [Microbacterium sp. KACC 23027]
MLRSRKVLTIATTVTAVTALSLGLGACSGGGGNGGSDGQQTVVWSTWGTPQELTRYKEFDAQFMKDHPNIKVVLQPVADYGDYHTKLLTELASGTAPDVFYIGDDQIGKFVNSNVLMPLNELMSSKDSKTKPDDFAQGLLGAAEKDDKILAEPNDSNPDALWYDKVALKKAGITEDPATLASEGKWTTQKYLEMNDKLHAAGLTGSMFWNYWSTHWSWISSQGGKAFDDNGDFVANTDPTSVAAMDTFGKYFQDKTFVVADTLPSGAGADSVFVTHKAGFFIQGRYTIGTVKSAGDPQNYDVAPWPTPDGKAAPTGVAVSYLAINDKTKVKDAAFTFWTNFLSKDGQTFRLKGSGNAVPSIKGADSVVLDGYPDHAQTLLDMRDLGFEDYATEAQVPGLSTDVSDIMLKLYQGKLTGQQALDQSAQLISSKTSGK